MKLKFLIFSKLINKENFYSSVTSKIYVGHVEYEAHAVWWTNFDRLGMFKESRVDGYHVELCNEL